MGEERVWEKIELNFIVWGQTWWYQEFEGITTSQDYQAYNYY